MHNQAEKSTRKPRAPGILAVLPENLPYYPYNHNHQNDNNGSVYKHLRKRGRKRPKESERIIAMEEFGCEVDVIFDKPLGLIDGKRKDGFTLFFFVDSNNRQSLMSIPIVSKWCHYSLNATCGDDDVAGGNDEGMMNRSRVICIPNQPSPSEIHHVSKTDSTAQENINSTSTATFATTKCHALSIIQGTGFYQLPFEHKSRLPLLHLLSATRVPSIIVVSNTTGRIITRYGWEAIEREGSGPASLLERWIDASFVENKKCDGEDREEMEGFESNVVGEWNVGRSGLPLWWHVVSFIL